MKLLVIASALDIQLPYSSTPSWWQLLKALAEAGVDVIATPYVGDAFDTPWWRSYENPCRVEGMVAARAKSTMARFATPGTNGASASADERPVDRLTRQFAQAWVKPRWERHLSRILEREPDIAAVLVLTIPLNQIAGVPRAIEKRYGVPFFFYDGDIPASLPRFAGFQSGFRIYQGADLSEYAAFFSNSLAGGDELRQMGAREVETLYYAVDPTVFAPLPVQPDIDVFFYGHGGEYRREWISAMLGDASKRMPSARFAVRGSKFGVDLGRTETLPYLSLTKVREYCCRSRINLLITRQAHASVYGSSTARPFELAALGSCMVSNPYAGIETWFEPEREVIVVTSAGEAVERYQWLLSHETERQRIGAAARERLLREHTYTHRAAQVVQFLQSRVASPTARA